MSRLVHGGPHSPYEILRRFSPVVTGSGDKDDLPARMAAILADGTGAKSAQVWLMVGDRPTLAATWPPSAQIDPGEDPLESGLRGRRVQPVRHGSELL